MLRTKNNSRRFGGRLKPLDHKDRVKRLEHWGRTNHIKTEPHRRGFDQTVIKPRLTITQARKKWRRMLAEFFPNN